MSCAEKSFNFKKKASIKEANDRSNILIWLHDIELSGYYNTLYNTLFIYYHPIYYTTSIHYSDNNKLNMLHVTTITVDDCHLCQILEILVDLLIFPVGPLFISPIDLTPPKHKIRIKAEDRTLSEICTRIKEYQDSFGVFVSVDMV